MKTLNRIHHGPLKPTRPGTNPHRVLQYLKTGHSLDLPKATSLWGHIRLSDAIHSLREKGYSIITDLLTSAASNAEFGVYRLDPKHIEKPERVKVISGSFKGRTGSLLSHPSAMKKVHLDGDAEGSSVLFFADQLEALNDATA